MHELDPRERALQAEGEAMLRAIQPQGSAIVGADGMPLQGKSPSEELKKKAEELKKKREELGEKVKELMDGDKRIAQCVSQVLAGYRLLFWSLHELSTCEGITPEMVEFVSAAMRASATNHGFDIGRLLLQFKTEVIPFLHDRNSYYAEIQKVRKAKLRVAERRMRDEGLKFPWPSLSSLFPEKVFRPGNVLVLYGDQASLSAAMRVIAKQQHAVLGILPYVLAAGDLPKGEKCGYAPVAETWWSGCLGGADGLKRFDEVMKPFLVSEDVLLLIENLGLLWVDDDRRPLSERLGRSYAKMYEWAYEQLVCVILGVVVREGELPGCGEIPSCPVRLQTLDGKSYVVIGSDVVLLE